MKAADSGVEKVSKDVPVDFTPVVHTALASWPFVARTPVRVRILYFLVRDRVREESTDLVRRPALALVERSEAHIRHTAKPTLHHLEAHAGEVVELPSVGAAERLLALLATCNFAQLRHSQRKSDNQFFTEHADDL